MWPWEQPHHIWVQKKENGFSSSWKALPDMCSFFFGREIRRVILLAAKSTFCRALQETHSKDGIAHHPPPPPPLPRELSGGFQHSQHTENHLRSPREESRLDLKEARDLQHTSMGVAVPGRAFQQEAPRTLGHLPAWHCALILLLGYTLSSLGAGPMAFIFIFQVSSTVPGT